MKQTAPKSTAAKSSKSTRATAEASPSATPAQDTVGNAGLIAQMPKEDEQTSSLLSDSDGAGSSHQPIAKMSLAAQFKAIKANPSAASDLPVEVLVRLFGDYPMKDLDVMIDNHDVIDNIAKQLTAAKIALVYHALSGPYDSEFVIRLDELGSSGVGPLLKGMSPDEQYKAVLLNGARFGEVCKKWGYGEVVGKVKHGKGSDDDGPRFRKPKGSLD